MGLARTSFGCSRIFNLGQQPRTVALRPQLQTLIQQGKKSSGNAGNGGRLARIRPCPDACGTPAAPIRPAPANHTAPAGGRSDNPPAPRGPPPDPKPDALNSSRDRKSTRLNS